MAMTSDGNGAMMPVNNATAPQPASGQATAGGSTLGQFTDSQLLEMWKRWKRESFDQRWIFERQWMRNLWYLLSRQWIYFDSKRGQWQDKRLAKWMPRPVTNILMTGVDSVRSSLASINYGIGARPSAEDNLSVITASVADDYAEILWQDHKMNQVMTEFDFWMLGCGNAWLHTCIDYSLANGAAQIDLEMCTFCGQESRSDAIANAGQKCPSCGQPAQHVMQPTGKQVQAPLPKGTTLPLSPFEVAFPLMYERYDLSPFTIRMRWRDKSYYEQRADLKPYVNKLGFSKTPQERTMQIFKTLPFQSDLGVAPPYFASGGANVQAEGVVEYDVYVKPCADFPDGQVIRFAGDSNPMVIHSEEEKIPGPLPYHDARGNPLFTFHHARYRQMGGRAIGASLIDPAIQKVDQLNQIDSHMLMILGRMANPIWLEPKGAEVEKFTGEPGLVVKWNPLVANGNARPERIPGENIPQSAFQYREQVKSEAEELMGTYDILKGEKPSGVEAYATMSFLYERAMGRHASAFKERADAVKGWFRDALEIEREFGDDQRVLAVMGPTKGWAFDVFKKADLGGDIEIIIEDSTPKTLLTERATIDHLQQLGLIDPMDTDMKTEIFKKFGQSSLMPGIDAQVQEAWMNMENFEKFLNDPQAIAAMSQQAQMATQQAQMTGQPPTPMGPLVFKRWYDPTIHRKELIKWCLSDRGRKVFQQSPAAEQYVDTYLSQIDAARAAEAQGMVDSAGVMLPTQPPGGPPPGPPPPPVPGRQPGQQGAFGRAQQMRNSTQNASQAGPHSSSALGTSQPSR